MARMPGAKGGHYDGGIKGERHGSGFFRQFRPTFPDLLQSPFHYFFHKWLNGRFGHNNSKAPALLKAHFNPRRPDSDLSFLEDNINRVTGPKPRNLANLFGNYHPSGAVYGSFHAIIIP